MDSNSELSESHPIQSLMTPGEMYLPQEEYFGYVKDYAEDENIIWRKVYDRLTCKVFVKKNNLSSFNVVKIWSQYDDVSPEILYNVIHDAEYRSTWDSHMIEGFELDCVATNSDVGYYSLKLPIPLSNRDFVTQRCWKDYGIGKDKIIFNHSVNHPKAKEKGGFIRGLSFLTAYIIMPWENGCRFYYLTQSDPKGNIPVYLVNWSTSSLAYKTSENLHKACLKYNEWKLKQSNPNFKPWLAPRTITLNISPTVCPMLKKKSEDVISFMNQSLDSFYSTITDISPKNDHHKNNEKKQYKSESNQLNVDSFNPIKSEYSKKVYSKNQIGVCFTNSIFSQLISSELLMSKVTNLITKNDDLIKKLVKAVEGDPHAFCIHPHELVETGDLLRHSLIQATKGRQCDYQYGLAGEYYLLKHYYEQLRKRKMLINYNDNIKLPVYRMESHCLVIMGSKKLQQSRTFALKIILRDLFDSQLIHFETMTFGLDDKDIAVYYPTVKLLTIEQKPPPANFYQYSRISSNLFEFLNEDVFKHLKEQLFDNKTSAPDHIVFDYRTNPGKFEIHPATFQNFGSKLLHLYKAARFRQYSRFVNSFQDVNLSYGTAGMKLPKDFSSNFLRQKFVVDLHDYFYETG
ncbi:hypothetical protein SNEBB_000847 [Seison nebaliae]|nr:hypothetical protein SNEBB_000847 [Seison nebaliae]